MIWEQEHQLREENRRLRAALEKYGKHHPACLDERRWARGPCDCGFSAALAGRGPEARKCDQCGGTDGEQRICLGCSESLANTRDREVAEQVREACVVAIPEYDGSSIGFGAGLIEARRVVRALDLDEVLSHLK